MSCNCLHKHLMLIRRNNKIFLKHFEGINFIPFEYRSGKQRIKNQNKKLSLDAFALYKTLVSFLRYCGQTIGR